MRTLKSYNEYYNKINESYNKMANINSMIDYTQLDPTATDDMIIDLCKKADELGVKSVCVLPKMVSLAAEELADSNVLVCTVVSFPEGTDTPEQKLAECKQVIADGADEVDMVLNYPLIIETSNGFRNEEGKEVTFLPPYSSPIELKLINEVEALVDICHMNRNKNGGFVVLKVIVESGLLNEEETELATNICIEAGADFIKTSTGKVSVGAEVDKVKIMRDIINKEGSIMKIKASGGIRTISDVEKFLPYVDRLGIGFAAVDKMNGIDSGIKSNY